MALEDIKAISLSKDFLLDSIFKKYPLIAHKIKEGSQYRYFYNIKKVLLAKREEHILKINKESPYKQINISDKNTGNNDSSMQPSKLHQLS